MSEILIWMNLRVCWVDLCYFVFFLFEWWEVVSGGNKLMVMVGCFGVVSE